MLNDVFEQLQRSVFFPDLLGFVLKFVKKPFSILFSTVKQNLNLNHLPNKERSKTSFAAYLKTKVFFVSFHLITYNFLFL